MMLACSPAPVCPRCLPPAPCTSCACACPAEHVKCRAVLAWLGSSKASTEMSMSSTSPESCPLPSGSDVDAAGCSTVQPVDTPQPPLQPCCWHRAPRFVRCSRAAAAVVECKGRTRVGIRSTSAASRSQTRRSRLPSRKASKAWRASTDIAVVAWARSFGRGATNAERHME